MVDELRQQCERYRSAQELERFEAAQGRRPFIDLQAVDERFPELLTRESIDAVQAAIESAARDEDAAESRRLPMLRAWLVEAFTEREVRSIDQAIEKAARAETSADGEDHPLRDARLLLAQTADPDDRARLDEARVKAARALQPLLRERIGIAHGIARSFDKASFLELWADCLQADAEALKKLCEDALAATDDMYEEVLGWTVRKRLGCQLEDAHRRDMPYVFAARYTNYAGAFSVKDLLATLRSFLTRLGLELTCEGRLKLIHDPARRSPERAVVCPIAIPADIRLILQFDDGQRDLLKLLHNLGRALFLANINPAAPFEDRVLGDGALDLTYALLFQNLLLDRSWLKRGLGFARPKDYLIIANLERLYDLRLSCARTLYELELYSGTALDAMPERFEQIFERAIRVQTPRDFFLHEVRKPFHSAPQLRARIFEAQFAGHLAHYFNEDWWQNPQTGAFLKKEWHHGRRLKVEDRAQEMGYDGLQLKPLLKIFAKIL